MHDLNGSGFKAKFDGKRYPMVGVVGSEKTTVALRRTSDRSYEETQREAGKTTVVVRLTIEPDGKRGHATIEDRRDGTSYAYTLTRR
jgi:hypothetical protein